ncbi:MAG: hypothetical protein IKP76_04330 [Bacilli bacterium]|nr:hypothetical protein [Bacilli bacterium]
MKKVLIVCIVIISIFSITGCNRVDNSMKVSDDKMINVIIDGKTYKLNLESNTTVDEFIRLLPKEYTMNELNGNEKYVYINESLSTNKYKPKRIEKGDVMLYGDNCIVIFYKSFDTNYSYTKIGHIDDLDDLGNKDIVVRFE